MSWHMTMVTDEDARVERDFDTFEEGVEWLRENEPGMLSLRRWRTTTREDFKQFGTDYYWTSFERRAS